jgi:hypothetical protein
MKTCFGLLLVFGVLLMGQPAIAASSDVPCGVFSSFNGYVRPGPCGNPFSEGVVDGQWIGIVMMFSGGNGGAISAHLYGAGHGGNGPLTIDLGHIDAISEYGNAAPDGLQIFFKHGKLIAVNKVAHNSWDNFVGRQFGFHNSKLVSEKQTTFTYHRRTWSESDFESASATALATVPSSY